MNWDRIKQSGGFAKGEESRPTLWAAGILAIALVSASAAPAQTPSVLYNFGANATAPATPLYGSLVQGRDGNLYGTTQHGGTGGQGTLFKITPSGTLSVIHSFDTIHGASPLGGLTLGTDGNFYGASRQGGSSTVGTVFKITPAGSFTVLYNFQADVDGQYPGAPPVQATDGNFYGTTGFFPLGGCCGTIYKMTPAGVLTTIHQFDGSDGNMPIAPLIQAADGNLYGTSIGAGYGGVGSVFKISTSGTFSVLYNFDDTNGSTPWGPVVQGGDGNFYGTTQTGGSADAGVVFKLTSAGVITVLHNFGTTSGDGIGPVTGLVQGNDGRLYGVTLQGGTLGFGTIFSVTTAGNYSVLYSFDSPTTGSGPYTALTEHTNGKLFGTTYQGGGFGAGTLFTQNVGLKAFVKLVPPSGRVGQTIGILGGSLTGTTSVAFNGKPATFTVTSANFISAQVPAGATSGFVTVVTPSGTVKSNQKFLVR